MIVDDLNDYDEHQSMRTVSSCPFSGLGMIKAEEYCFLGSMR